MKLVNIANIGRKIYLFIRHDNGELEVREDSNFYPYYYSENPDGTCVSYNGKPLKKLFVSKPSDIRKQAGMGSWESDVKFPTRYLIDKVDTIEKTKIKYSFIDIETLSKEMPDPMIAPDPISCISSSNSFTDKIATFYLGDYDSEYNMIQAFINYMQKEQYDLMLGWNFEKFDWLYLCNRIPDLAKNISPIFQERYVRDEIRYPAGTSVVDYMLLDKKITLNRKREYTLNARLFETIGREKEIKKLAFSKLSPELKQRNINDVRDMIEMEKKLNYIPMLDGIRRVSKTQWEDYQYNSRVIDNLLLTEARKKKIVLPNKPKKEDGGTDFEGAFREVYNKGRQFDVTSYDLSGAYLNTIIELCLDPVNITDTEGLDINVTDRVTNNILNTYKVKQDTNTLLPIVAKKLLDEKNKFKELLKNTNPNSSEFKDIEEKYKAYKGISLSTWGVMGNKYFRYYDHRICSMITSAVRDLLHYVIDEIEILGYKTLYVDTDGIIVDAKGKNIVTLLNELVQKWSQNRYKRNTKIIFDYEGNWEKLFILAMCRYKGYLRHEDGTLEEKVVGIEAKRKDSTIYLKGFQTELLEKLMNNESKESIISWIKNEIKELRNKPLHEISFPAKIANKTYKNLPIFKRALDNTEGFEKKIGSLFYWLYTKPIGEPNIETHVYVDNEIYEILKYDVDKPWILERYAQKDIDKKRIKVLHKKDKPINVQAFDEEKFEHIDRNKVDWALMIKRNIINKVGVIFEAMDWSIEELGFIEEKKIKLPSETPQNKAKATGCKEIKPKAVEALELPESVLKKANIETKDEVAEYIKNLKKDKKVGSAEEVSKEKRLGTTKESEVRALASAPIKNKENEKKSISDTLGF